MKTNLPNSWNSGFFQKLQQQTVELQLQLQTKELEKQVLQTTLQTELIKQQLQQVKDQSNAAEKQQLKKEPAPPPPAKKYSRSAVATSNAVALPKQVEPVSNGVDRSKEVKWAKKVQVIEREPEDTEVRAASSVKAPPLSPALSKKRVSSPLPPKLPEQDQQMTSKRALNCSQMMIVSSFTYSISSICFKRCDMAIVIQNLYDKQRQQTTTFFFLFFFSVTMIYVLGVNWLLKTDVVKLVFSSRYTYWGISN